MTPTTDGPPVTPATPSGRERNSRHHLKVARIADRLRRRRSGAPLSLLKRSVSHQVPKRHDRKYRDERIDLSDLDEIIEIDPERRLCIAEPGVPFFRLVERTLPMGYVPIMVPELKTITIGGAVAGCSIESTSFRYGGFHDTCLEYEVITARGEVLTCTADNRNALIFQMMHGSFGTVGILSRLVFRLIPAKPFVSLRHETFASLDRYLEAIEARYQNRDVDFMDGIIHSPSQMVLCLGDFVDSVPYASRYDWLKIYYLSTARRSRDYLATPDYFFRYDRGVTCVRPGSFLGRLLLGRFLASSEILRLAEKLRWLVLSDRRPPVTVDTFLPVSRFPEFLEWHTRVLGHFPLWVVPYRRVRDYEWISGNFWAGIGDSLFIDLAIYGMKQPRGTNVYRLLEEKLQELNGIKTLISYNYYSEDEFWRIFNRATHQEVKAITDPDDLFRDLYQKTCRAAMGLDQR